MSTAQLLLELQACVGSNHVLRPSDAEPWHVHQTDWRKRYQGHALAIVKPGSADEVSQIVRICARHGASIVPQGGNTSLVGASVADESGTQVVLNLQRLNRILACDPADLSITVEAGCTLAQVQAAADEAGMLFPLSLASEGSCTIGGNLATNAGGTQVLRYGTARELCLGLQAVTAQGEVWDGLKALRKDNTGYDIRDLLIGSEGTLGIITHACLRLYPKPLRHQAALLGCNNLHQAVALLRLARQHLDARLTGFEVMHRLPIELAQRHQSAQAQASYALQQDAATTLPTWTVLLDACESSQTNHLQPDLEALLTQALSDGLADHCVLSASEAQYRAMWQLREAIPSAEKIEGHMIKHDIGVPTSKVPEFVALAEVALEHMIPGCRIVCFGHLGDGNLHYNVQAPPGMGSADFLAEHESAVHGLIYDLALRLNGTISAEHGIGRLKRQDLAARQSATRTAWMRAIKTALDPQGLLNPNRLVP